MIEKPPILQGSTNDQVRALRDYLYKLAGTLDGTIQAATAMQNVTVSVDKQGRQVISAGSDVGSKTAAAIQKSADELKSLIIKSADEVYEYMDGKTEEYDGKYVAKSEYGEFTQSFNSRVETTARGVVEDYGYTEQITSLQNADIVMQQYLTDLNGQIRRGIVLDPSTNQYVTGIAISQQLSTSGTCPPLDPHNPGDGYTYYYLTAGQTFGLYTSTGWQFWLNGAKKGWFDSQENVLNVYDIVIKGTLRIGNAVFSMSDRFDVKPIGA